MNYLTPDRMLILATCILSCSLRQSRLYDRDAPTNPRKKMVEKFRNTVDNTPFQRNQVMLLPVVTVRQ